jgi:hypothetical protein
VARTGKDAENLLGILINDGNIVWSAVDDTHVLTICGLGFSTIPRQRMEAAIGNSRGSSHRACAILILDMPPSDGATRASFPAPYVVIIGSHAFNASIQFLPIVIA